MRDWIKSNFSSGSSWVSCIAAEKVISFSSKNAEKWIFLFCHPTNSKDWKAKRKNCPLWNGKVVMGHSSLHFADHSSHTPAIYQHISSPFLPRAELPLYVSDRNIPFLEQGSSLLFQTSACFTTSTHLPPYRGAKQTSNLETIAFLKAISATVQNSH